MAAIELYELDGCPYCEKVTRKLDELGLEYDSHYVSASHADRQEVKEISGGTQVPVIVDEAHGVEGMDESDDIVRYLEETYGEGSDDGGAAEQAEQAEAEG